MDVLRYIKKRAFICLKHSNHHLFSPGDPVLSVPGFWMMQSSLKLTETNASDLHWFISLSEVGFFNTLPQNGNISVRDGH